MLRLIRSLVIQTHTWPIARSLYRIPYQQAVVRLGRSADATPGIIGLFARGSFATGRWVPGRSDIDVTAIIGRGVAAEAEMEASRRLQLRIDELRRRLPMVGEVEFLHEDCLPAYSAHALTGFESGSWRVVKGDLKAPHWYRATGDRLRRDRLAHALRVYRKDVGPALHSGSRRTLARLAGKILRCLDQVLPEGMDHLPEPALIELAFGALRRECNGPVPEELPARIPSVIDPNAAYTIANETPGPADFGTASAPRIPCTEAMLYQYLSLTDPTEFLLLQMRRQLPACYVLEDGPLREAVCRYAVDIYTYPFRREAMECRAEAFEPMLDGWFLWTLRYLETGERSFQSESIRTYIRKFHADLRLETETSLERFTLLRDVSQRIAVLAAK